MNLNQFTNWAISQGSVGKATDGQYVGECVSLINQYLSKVYGIQAGAWGHAKDWATNGSVLSHFDRVSSPQAGDIGVLGATASNPYGHIWIYLSPTTILEQNGRVSRRVSTGNVYANPIAILRRKGTPQQGADIMQQNEANYNRANDLHKRTLGRPLDRAVFNQLVANGTSWLRYIEIVSDSQEAASWLQTAETGRVAVRDNWPGQIGTLQKQFGDATKTANDLQARLVASDNSTKALTEKVDKLNAKVGELESPDNIIITRGGWNGAFDKARDFFSNLIGGKK